MAVCTVTGQTVTIGFIFEVYAVERQNTISCYSTYEMVGKNPKTTPPQKTTTTTTQNNNTPTTTTNKQTNNKQQQQQNKQKNTKNPHRNKNKTFKQTNKINKTIILLANSSINSNKHTFTEVFFFFFFLGGGMVRPSSGVGQEDGIAMILFPITFIVHNQKSNGGWGNGGTIVTPLHSRRLRALCTTSL